MREILFRGKCIDETCLKGKWLEGDILHDGVTGKYYINTGNCLNESDIVGEEGLLRFVAYEVDPETVCQYTGLTDKDGRKIFEGDIVKAIYKPKDEDLTIDDFIINWDKYYCKYVGHYVRKENVYNPLLFGSQTSFEVIGNIFDNPELLKGDTENVNPTN